MYVEAAPGTPKCGWEMEEERTAQSYRIKDIQYFGSPRRILLQNENGPCPLLAICNVLLLRNQLKIGQDAAYISFLELIQILSNLLFDLNAKSSGGEGGSGDNLDNTLSANIRQSLDSCIESSLQKGK